MAGWYSKYLLTTHYGGLPQWLSGKESACNAGAAGDTGSIPEQGRSPGGGHGNPLQYSCLENPMDRGAWRATVHGVAQSQTGLKRLSTHALTRYRTWSIRTGTMSTDTTYVILFHLGWLACSHPLLLLSHCSRVRLLGTPWTAAHQAPPSMGFSRQEHWSGVPLPSLAHILYYISIGLSFYWPSLVAQTIFIIELNTR